MLSLGKESNTPNRANITLGAATHITTLIYRTNHTHSMQTTTPLDEAPGWVALCWKVFGHITFASVAWRWMRSTKIAPPHTNTLIAFLSSAAQGSNYSLRCQFSPARVGVQRQCTQWQPVYFPSAHTERVQQRRTAHQTDRACELVSLDEIALSSRVPRVGRSGLPVGGLGMEIKFEEVFSSVLTGLESDETFTWIAMNTASGAYRVGRWGYASASALMQWYRILLPADNDKNSELDWSWWPPFIATAAHGDDDDDDDDDDNKINCNWREGRVLRNTASRLEDDCHGRCTGPSAGCWRCFRWVIFIEPVEDGWSPLALMKGNRLHSRATPEYTEKAKMAALLLCRPMLTCPAVPVPLSCAEAQGFAVNVGKSRGLRNGFIKIVALLAASTLGFSFAREVASGFRSRRALYVFVCEHEAVNWSDGGAFFNFPRSKRKETWKQRANMVEIGPPAPVPIIGTVHTWDRGEKIGWNKWYIQYEDGSTVYVWWCDESLNVSFNFRLRARSPWCSINLQLIYNVFYRSWVACSQDGYVCVQCEGYLH